ncbi:MAG: hypothetical protein MJ231_04615 [bacterium]|nr:hypothetical protein [bacterium]
MNIVSVTEKIFTWFGEKITPAFVSASIAGAKGIFRPIFTLSDKKQDKDSRSYAALREGLTEGIAIPVYLMSGQIATAIAKKKAKPDGMSDEQFKKIIFKKEPYDVKKLAGTKFEHATTQDMINLRNNFFKMKGTLSMLGVFASALVIIPALCSLTIKPIMRLAKNASQTSKKENQVATVAPKKQIFKGNPLNNVYSSYSYGMKVGGV